MKPYYEDPSGIVIYHGDCREILPSLPKVDLVLTDPPYGIKRDGMRPSTSSHGGRKAYDFLGWDDAPPTPDELRLVLAAGNDAVLWGANYYPAVLPPSMGWLVWDKGQRICSSDAELAFTTANKALRVFTLNRVALMQDGADHPTQKPVRLMLWCLDQFPEAQSVIDPYAGSGSTLVACKRRGLRGIGIEREEKYCEIAAKRLESERLTLFEAAGIVEPQQDMLLEWNAAIDHDPEAENGASHRSDNWLRGLGAQDAIREDLIEIEARREGRKA